MPGKVKKHFEVAIQRARRGKMGIPLQRYDDSSFNNITQRKFRRKPVKCGSKSWSLKHDAVHEKDAVETTNLNDGCGKKCNWGFADQFVCNTNKKCFDCEYKIKNDAVYTKNETEAKK